MGVRSPRTSILLRNKKPLSKSSHNLYSFLHRKSSKMSKAEGDSEVHISLSDQQKINKFARLNNRLEDLKEDLKSKKNELQTLEDAGTDLMMLEDDDEKVPYQVGEVFVYLSQERVQSELDARKEEVEVEVKVAEAKAASLKEQMADLKTKLYAKFGNAINLEAEEES